MSLTQLSDAAAESLSKHQGYLNLSSLTELSDAAAESLSKHQEENLSLDGLAELSDAVAEPLSKYQGQINDMDRVPKWSERTEGDLAGLLECRHERKRAVIWTTNAPSE